MRSTLPLIFAASAYFHLSAASPLYADSDTTNLDTRATYNCTDLDADPSTLCWDELDISDYLEDWNRTTPKCQATREDGVGCCIPQEPWTTCFLRLSYGGAGTDCSVITTQQCSLQQLSPSLDPSIAPKVGYVVRNIVVINDIFTSFYTAIEGQGTTISGSYSATLQQIVKASITLNNGNIVKALLAGLPFWGTPTVLAGGPQQIKPNVEPGAQAFAQSLQNTPKISSMLFGAPYNSSSSIASVQGQHFDEFGTELQSALGLIMGDVPTFSAWAAHGLYSGPTTSTSVSQAAVGLTSALDTYLTGEVLSQAHFSATPSSTTVSKEAFQQGRTCTTLGDVCKDSKGRTYYWSQAYQTQYQINEPKNWASGSAAQLLGYEADAYGLMEYIETTDAYMPVLFDGAYNCTLEGKAAGSAVNLNTNGSLDVACLSSLPIYLSKGSSCPSGAVQVGGKCPFGFNG